MLRFCWVLLGSSLLQAQTPQKFDLTIDNIMRGPGLIGHEPTEVRWSGDSQRIYFRWKQYSDPIRLPRDTYTVNRDGTGLRKLSDDEAKLAPPVPNFANHSRTRDRQRMVYSQDGDIFLYDFAAGKARQLTKTAEVESWPHFTQDETRVAFMRANNLFTISLAAGVIQEWTNIGKAPEEPKLTPEQEILKKQERELLETVNDRAKTREETEAKKKRENPRKPFELRPDQTLLTLELCPNEKCVAALISEGAKGAKNQNVPAYVTESSFPEEIPGRSNVGDLQDRQRIALIDTATGEVTWVQSPTESKPATKLETKPEAKPESKSETKPEKPPDREVEMFPLAWSDTLSDDGTKAVLIARAMDNKDRWIMALDSATGKTRVLFTEHDDAWIGGPSEGIVGWLKNNQDIYFTSERDGYEHLYTLSITGGEPRQLTAGKFEVLDAMLSPDGAKFYLTTNEGSPFEQHFYEMPVTGGPRTRITKDPGKHDGVLSPDGKWLADVHSFTNRPPELFAMENHPGANAKQLTHSPAPEFFDYAWQDVPIVDIPARDGVKVPARMYRPKTFARGGPAVIFVHGAGYLQNVHRWWSQYSANYMFHHYLLERGYLVLDVDYRASSGYGRDWRTAIYRHMGGKDLEDQVDAAAWLASTQGVDAKRLGIYGGSYGGFITLMAMFTTPDVFAAGAALRPVTDWSHYNHGYTANILNTPEKDPEAYKISSPIYFAQGLKGALLIAHGMVDTNVFFQDSVRLTQKLIELRKENWTFAPYPVEDHGFVQPSSWADEYKRIFSLFEGNLKR